MKLTHLVLWVAGVLVGGSSMQAHETARYQSASGVIATSLRIGTQTAVVLELNKEMFGEGERVFVTVRERSSELGITTAFILCDGNVRSRTHYVGPLRFVLPNGRLAEWVVRMERYEERSESKSPNGHILYLRETVEESVKDLCEKAEIRKDSEVPHPSFGRRPAGKPAS